MAARRYTCRSIRRRSAADMLAKIVDAFAGGVEQIIRSFGLPGITLIALLENLFPPTPSEFLYPLAGKLAYDGKLSPWGVIAAGVLGSLIGSLTYYGLGYWLGADRTRAAIVRFGQVHIRRFAFTLVAVEDYDRAVALFQRRGGSIVLIARLVPLVHSVVSIPAGVIHMRLPAFIIYTALGSLLWIAPLTLIGMWLGSNWQQVLYWLDVYAYVWYVLMGAGIMYMIIRRLRSSL
jgi:membrane protein DedA with SNARE-associated domain